MLLEVLLSGSGHLQSNELVASLLESGNDFTDESSLDTVRLLFKQARVSGLILQHNDRLDSTAHLDHDVSLFGRHFGGWMGRCD